MWIAIGLGSVAAVGAFLAFVATRPGTFRFERSTLVAAPAEAIFALLNDFQQWTKWSPYEEKDPNMQRTYGGARTGVGSIYSWAGNKEIGEGKMTILESRPNEQVVIKLEFFKPMKATSQAIFSLKPTATGVSVTWAMTGTQSFMCKAISLFMN